MIVYRLTDRIPAKIGGLTFWLAPLSFEQKANLLDCRKMEGGVEVVDSAKRCRLSIKYALKKVEGLKCADGSDYMLEMGPDGVLTDDAVNEVMSLDCMVKLVSACMSLLGGVSDPGIEGVEFDLKGVVNEKKA